MSYASYPTNYEKYILSDMYNVKKKPKLNYITSETAYNLYYPYTATKMSSYEQVTNNKRYWPQPSNGTSTYLEFNNSLYKSY